MKLKMFFIVVVFSTLSYASEIYEPADQAAAEAQLEADTEEKVERYFERPARYRSIKSKLKNLKWGKKHKTESAFSYNADNSWWSMIFISACLVCTFVEKGSWKPFTYMFGVASLAANYLINSKCYEIQQNRLSTLEEIKKWKDEKSKFTEENTKDAIIYYSAKIESARERRALRTQRQLELGHK